MLLYATRAIPFGGAFTLSERKLESRTLNGTLRPLRHCFKMRSPVLRLDGGFTIDTTHKWDSYDGRPMAGYGVCE